MGVRRQSAATRRDDPAEGGNLASCSKLDCGVILRLAHPQDRRQRLCSQDTASLQSWTDVVYCARRADKDGRVTEELRSAQTPVRAELCVSRQVPTFCSAGARWGGSTVFGRLRLGLCGPRPTCFSSRWPQATGSWPLRSRLAVRQRWPDGGECHQEDAWHDPVHDPPISRLHLRHRVIAQVPSSNSRYGAVILNQAGDEMAPRPLRQGPAASDRGGTLFEPRDGGGTAVGCRLPVL